MSEPVLAGPMPRDPKSIDVWPTILAATRTWARQAVPLFLLFAAFVVPLLVLLALSAPSLAGSMLGRTPTSIEPREWFGFAGVLLLGVTIGGLVTVAVFLLADRALAGEPLDWGQAFGRALERVPAAFAAYILVALILSLPILLLVAFIVAFVPQDAPPTPPFVVGFLLGFFLFLPIAVAVGMHLRFGPVLAAVRGMGPVLALRESVDLVRGRCWRALGYVMLVGVIVQAVLTGALSLGILLYALHPVAGCVAYALAIAASMPFQILQEVALLRRLEAIRAQVAAEAGAGLVLDRINR